MKLFARILIVYFAVIFAAEASLNDALSGMFSGAAGNTTSGGSYASATRGGYVFGGSSIRTPVKPITLATFDPPRVNAGCGGIDMYLGSFSFINKDAFTQLLRQIMNNAVGLLFQAALQAMSPSMSHLLSDFQGKIQKLNEMLGNTCKMAETLIDKTGAKAAAANVGTAIGKTTDTLMGTYASNADEKSNEQGTEDQNPGAGNFLWRALHRSQAADAIGIVGQAIDPNDPNGNSAKLFIVSLVGTGISSAYVKESNNANNTQPIYRAEIGPTIATLNALWETNGTLPTLDCDPASLAIGGDTDAYGPHSCVEMIDKPLDFPGTLNYVKNMLYGDSSLTTGASIVASINNYSAKSPGPNSIYGKLFNCTSYPCTLSNNELAFLRIAGPVINLVKEVQTEKDSIIGITDYIVEPMASDMLERLGEAAINAATRAWSKVPDIRMPDYIKRRVEELRKELVVRHQITMGYKDRLDKARSIAETVRKNLAIAGSVK